MANGALAKQVVLMAIAAIDVLVDSCPVDYVMSFSVKPRKRRGVILINA